MNRVIHYQEVQKILNENLRQLFGLFAMNGFEIRFVGGCVRDLLMKQVPKDVDLSTTATPDQMMSVFKENKIRFIETGLSHGTLTVNMNGENIEITTLRIDKKTFGRKANVEFTNDWRLDAERRDLTINAMSLDVDGNLYDYFEGENDLNQGKVRFVGDAEMRIREDYLRILRYFRFFGRVAPSGDQHDESTLLLIGKTAIGLKGISVERIWVEVSKILRGRFAPSLINTMYDCDVAKHIGLPAREEDTTKEFERVWERCDIDAISPVSLLTAFVKNEKDALELSTKWKLSNYDKNLSCFIAANRDLPVDVKDPLKTYQDLIIRKNNANVKEMIDELLNYLGKHTERWNIKQWKVPKFPICGNDLKNQGIKPGPSFGKLMNALKEKWIESRYEMTKDVLIREMEEIKKKLQNK